MAAVVKKNSHRANWIAIGADVIRQLSRNMLMTLLRFPLHPESARVQSGCAEAVGANVGRPVVFQKG
jgi:hypothetical protein